MEGEKIWKKKKDNERRNDWDDESTTKQGRI